MRGYFEIGIYHTKTEVNIGTLWRSAYQLGAAGIFTIGRRYAPQASDTPKTPRHIPLRHYADFDDFNNHRPSDAQLVGIEMGTIEHPSVTLGSFIHPARAIYLLGAEDHGLSAAVMSQCQHVVELQAYRLGSFNVAVAGSLVMYDRMFRPASGVRVIVD
jgi:tRNA G18 (ribose-2'-O)-methylase SpoU